jgi:bis(5'-nucleosidyl)-tetraphosphatase
MNCEISCGFLLIDSESHKILLLKSLNKIGWDLPKGHLENTETFLETAFREVKEETKIEKSQISIIHDIINVPLVGSYEYISPITKNKREIHLFVGNITQSPVISDEHSGFLWCSLDDGLNHLRFTEVQNCIRKLYSEYLESQK